jgi:hypothetical protein
MSIAFVKKDYYYDGDDIEYDNDVEEEEEEEEEGLETVRNYHRQTAIPLDWVISLYEELKDHANFNAVEIFDKLTLSNFATFLSQHSDNIYM